MDARRLIQETPTETLVTMVGLLTNGTVDPKFVRAIAMDIKNYKNDRNSSTQAKP